MFVVLSEFQKRRFVAGGIPEERIEILPNVVPAVDGHGGSDPEVSANSSQPRGATHRPEARRNPADRVTSADVGDLVIFCGRVSAEKGIADFLEAARALPEIPFAVAGGYDPASSWVRSSPENVQWLGFLNNAELNALYGRTRILVLPSRCFEGFPNVITRAMAMQRAVIASRTGVMPEIVSDETTGLLFEPGNVADLVRQIRGLYSNPDLCIALGKAGRTKALAQYSEDAVYSQLMRIYEKAKEISQNRRL